jgi:poly(A) polymerase
VVSDSDRWARLKTVLTLLVEPNFALAFAVLLEAAGECGSEAGAAVSKLASQAGRRLKLSNHEIDDAGWLLKHRGSLDNASTLPLSQLKRVLAQRLAPDLIALIRARALSNDDHPDDAIFCEDYLRATDRNILDPLPLISGDDLIKAGFRPGPQFKGVLDRVRDAQLDLQINTPAEAMKMASQLATDD